MENSIQVNSIDKLVMQYTDKASTIVDLGAGSGALAHALLDVGYTDLHLVDIEKNFYLDGASGHDFYEVDLNFQPLEFKDDFADFIVLNSVIEHLENSYFVVREASRILKPGGMLLVTMPNVFSLRSKIKFLFTGNMARYTEANNHLSFYTKATFKKAFEEFKILEIHYSEGFIKIPRGKGYHFKIRFKPINGLFSSDIIYILKKV